MNPRMIPELLRINAQLKTDYNDLYQEYTTIMKQQMETYQQQNKPLSQHLEQDGIEQYTKTFQTLKNQTLRQILQNHNGGKSVK